MVYTTDSIKSKLLEAFPDKQAGILSEVVYSAYQDLVKTSDFNELKAIVKDLAQAQKRTEIRLDELAQAQKNTEIAVKELHNAQKNTEIAVKELADAQKQTEIEVRGLAVGLKETRGDLGGLTRTLGYAFENEAYRMAPKVLQERFGIELKEKLIRALIKGKEVNLLGKGIRHGKEVWIVGESKMRLDARRYLEQEDIFAELEEKVKAVQSEYGEVEIVRVLLTHFATPPMIKEAQTRGIIVLQSYEW